MAIVSCPECAGKVSDAAVACPHCGAPVKPVLKTVDPKPKKSGSVWKWILGVPVGLFLLMMVIGGINSDPEQNNARHAYGVCMDRLKDNDRARAGSGAFIAGACELMRNEYIKKYGSTP